MLISRQFISNPVKHVKTIWNRKNAYQKWHSFHKFIHFVGTIMRIEVFTKQPNGPLVYTGCVSCILHGALYFYTTIYYIAIGEFLRVIPAYCIFGIVVSSYALTWSVVTEKRFKWMPLFENRIYRNDEQPTEYNRICSEGMNNTIKTYVITMTVIIISFVGALIGPVYTYCKDGSLISLYEVRIPFLQDHPRTEFFLSAIWQAYISLLGIPVLFGMEGCYALINNTITVSSKLTQLELNQMFDQSECGETKKKNHGEKLKNIFRKIIYMDDYIENLEEATYWRCFLSPPSSTFAIGISIYSQFMLGYPAGYGIAVVSYVQMAVLCITGQNIVDRNMRLCMALSGFKWYLLPNQYQQDVIYMIQHLQNKNGLAIGPFDPLNFETLKILTQKVYSFSMFMINYN